MPEQAVHAPPPAQARIGSGRYGAFLFDLDGVVTDTASLHRRAWRSSFDEVVPEAGGFSEEDYRAYVDGRSRMDGITAFLSARGVRIPRGESTDSPSGHSMYGLAARKDALFLRLMAEHGVTVFEPTVKLIQRLRDGGIRTGLITASRNAARVVGAAGIGDLFDVRVDGVVADREGLPGKPDPATYLAAARDLGVDPGEAVVVEDALAGVRAGRAGGFGLVVGIDRTGDAAALRDGGADVVVSDLRGLRVELSDPDCLLCAEPVSEWALDYLGLEPEREPARETLLTLGNGVFATRGAAPEPGGHPGMYAAGVYNRLVSEVDGQVREDESMVNLPNWLPLTFRAQGGAWFATGAGEVLHEHRILDLRSGTLRRELLVSDAEGRRTRVRQQRLVSMAEPHLAGLRTTLVAENWSGRVDVRSGLNGSVRNDNVASFAGLADWHLDELRTGGRGKDLVWLTAQTTQSKVRVALAARTQVWRGTKRVRVEGVQHEEPGSVAVELTCGVGASEGITVDKLVALYTSRDRGISEPRRAAETAVGRAPGFEQLAAEHAEAWQRLWSRFRLRVSDGVDTQLAVNLHTFHLLQTLSGHTAELDVGVPARGLHGEGYRGHIFWDELFVLPYFNLRLPEVSRALLLYRHRRLPQARELAAALGLKGALFPWQSGSDGREETPGSFYNPRSGRWMADHSRLQYHVGLAVAYNVWHHFQTTGDLAFLETYGAEMIIEVARFWASIATHDSAADRYDIRGVMGPDEFHDGYPGRPGSGVDNNAYVNVMTAWVLRRAQDACGLLADRSRQRLAVTDEELAAWQHLATRLRLTFTSDGLLAQFEHYETLAELDWTRYRTRYGDIGRLDLVLEAEDDSTNGYQASKQADVLMLLYLFTAEELTDLVTGLGYDFDPATIPRTVDYYLARTTHGSTLSRVAHTWVLARADRPAAWIMLHDALGSDLADAHGTTGEGIHLGAVAGTLDILQRCFTGLDVHGGILRLHPGLPDELNSLTFDLRYRDHWLSLSVNRHELVLAADASTAAPIDVTVNETPYTLEAGRTLRVLLGTTVRKSS